MIDWLNLASNTLWILACALALATLSFVAGTGRRGAAGFRQRLPLPGPQLALNLAGVLFCLGLSGASGAGWERWVWLILALAFAFYVLQALVALRRAKASG